MQSLELEHKVIRRLLKAARLAQPQFRRTLYRAFQEELSRRTRELSLLYRPLRKVSWTARRNLETLGSEQASLLELAQRTPPEADLEELSQRLEELVMRELAVLAPLVRRLEAIQRTPHLSVSARLIVEECSDELSALLGRPPEQVVGRPVSLVLSPGDGLQLVLPRLAGGATVWYPPWGEQAHSGDFGVLGQVAAGPCLGRVREAIEGTLGILRSRCESDCARLWLQHPETSSLELTFQQGDGPPSATPECWEAPHREAHAVVVPLQGSEAALGCLQLLWARPTSLQERAFVLGSWAATPLAVSLEPLLEAMRYASSHRIAANDAAQVLGFNSL